MADTKRMRKEEESGAAAAVEVGGEGGAKMGDEGASAPLKYQSGFGNHFATEALPGALPVGQNTPQKCPYGLYAEQISGTAFTAPRNHNSRTWFYRIKPSIAHDPFQPVAANPFENDFGAMEIDPSQMRWSPIPVPVAPQRVNFVQGISTMGGAGDPSAKTGLSIYLYACNEDMGTTAFYNSDGEMLIVPQLGALRVRTECGILQVEVNEIIVIPRGIKFSVDMVPSADGSKGARGYILEVFEGGFVIPDLGPIGANCLANPRDFVSPVAWYEDVDGEYILLNKFGGKLFSAAMHHSPFDVVAWHGNMAPYKYDLANFICVNSVTKDHPDPSIYTVLTCQSNTPGVAVADFVIFPPRWMVQEDTFRPPWYHRNTMTEFMGMVWGKYDAKKGFVAGGSSLHSCMSAHGPDAPTFAKASSEKLEPVKFDKGLAFMFETSYMLRLSKFATDGKHRDRDYHKCWAGLPKLFNPDKK